MIPADDAATRAVLTSLHHLFMEQLASAPKELPYFRKSQAQTLPSHSSFSNLPVSERTYNHTAIYLKISTGVNMQEST